jgi:MFS family permease
MPVRLLIFLTLLNALNYFDRYIVQAVEPLLKGDFALSNKESGLLGSAFVVGYVLFSPIFGYLGDRRDRRLLMALGVFLWSLCTACTGLAGGFYSFLTARMMVGVGEAGFGALVPGFLKARIADTVALNSALSIFYMAIPLGSALGYVVGGLIGESWGWRWLFGMAAVPGLLCVAGFYWVAPDRRVAVATDGSVDFFAGVVRILRSRLLRLTIFGYVFNTFALNGVAHFVVRHVQGLGMEMSAAADSFGFILLISGVVGTVVGGRIASVLAARAALQEQTMLRFVSVSTLLGVPFLGVAFLMPTPGYFLGLCLFAALTLFAGVAPLNTVLVARAPKGLETLTQGVTILLIQLLGSAIAPVSIGTVADLLERFWGVPAGAALAWALQLSTVAMVLSAWLWWAAARAAGQAAVEDG